MSDHKLTYQPFVFVAAVLAVALKIYQMSSKEAPLVDWMFFIAVLLPLVALGVYLLDRPGRSDVSIRTGSAQEGTIRGVVGSSPGDVEIETADLRGVDITGRDER